MAKNTVNTTVRIGKKSSNASSGLKLKHCVLGEFRGNVLLNFEPEKTGPDDYPFQMGSRKLAMIAEHIEDVKAFIAAYPPKEGKGGGKFQRRR